MLRTLLTCLASAILGIGCATAPKPAPPTASTDTNCVHPPAASRIPQSNCGPGQSYTQDDIRSTGQPTAAGALPMLDPIIHH
ncbi:MAG TPA: hypothetical protein VGF35_05145 [Steroidobacteraceae bacterium]|jgi:hypothetical protein